MMNVASASENNVRKAAEIIKRGGVVIAPTDSVYGIFCDANNAAAVERICEIKGRKPRKPLQVAIQKKDAEKYGVLSEEARKIIDAFWPGDVNIIVEKKKTIPDYVSEKTVCLTCHRNKVAFRLVKLSGKPLISTSANFTGRMPAVWVGDLGEFLINEVDVVLDGGATHHKRPNTIVDLTVKPARIIREDPITAEKIRQIIELQS